MSQGTSDFGGAIDWETIEEEITARGLRRKVVEGKVTIFQRYKGGEQGGAVTVDVASYVGPPRPVQGPFDPGGRFFSQLDPAGANERPTRPTSIEMMLIFPAANDMKAQGVFNLRGRGRLVAGSLSAGRVVLDFDIGGTDYMAGDEVAFSRADGDLLPTVTEAF